MNAERLTAQPEATAAASAPPVRRAAQIGALAERGQRLRVTADDLRTVSTTWAAAPTRIRRAVRPAPEQQVIRRRVDQTWLQYKAANPLPPAPAPALGAPAVASPLLAVAVAYMQMVRAEFNLLPAELRQGAEGLLGAARAEGNRIGALPPTTAEVDEFVENYVDPLVDEVNRVADLVAGRQQAPAEEEEPWVYEAAELAARAPKTASDDLESMLARFGGSFHQAKIKTLIGGYAVKSKSCTKIQLNDATARIDVQAPPGENTFNIQYQAGGTSLANVVFCATDTDADIRAQLRESLRLHQKATSPGARTILARR